VGREHGARPLVGLANRTDGAGFEWPVRFFYDKRVPIEPRTHVVERTRQLVAAALTTRSRNPPTRSTSASTPGVRRWLCRRRI
jgi:hypothetical protein